MQDFVHPVRATLCLQITASGGSHNDLGVQFLGNVASYLNAFAAPDVSQSGLNLVRLRSPCAIKHLLFSAKAAGGLAALPTVSCDFESA